MLDKPSFTKLYLQTPPFSAFYFEVGSHYVAHSACFCLLRHWDNWPKPSCCSVISISWGRRRGYWYWWAVRGPWHPAWLFPVIQILRLSPFPLHEEKLTLGSMAMAEVTQRKHLVRHTIVKVKWIESLTLNSCSCIAKELGQELRFDH